MNALIILLSTLKFSKVLLPAASIILSIFTYAAGFIGLIFCHEMGHYIAAQQKNLNVGLPTFIPFIGAWIELKEQPMNAEVEAYVAYAGPFIGTIASFVVYYYGRYTASELALVLAQSGFIINLFNLIPLSPLDGGRITAIISPHIWFLGVPILLAVWLYKPSPMLILIAIISLPQLLKAWNYTSKNQESYYNIKSSLRFEYGVLYIGLVIILSLMIYCLIDELKNLR
nr:site-2 protease family protein [Rickettsia endosymbiont of Ceutorhynchus assimilis]